MKCLSLSLSCLICCRERPVALYFVGCGTIEEKYLPIYDTGKSVGEPHEETRMILWSPSLRPAARVVEWRFSLSRRSRVPFSFSPIQTGPSRFVLGCIVRVSAHSIISGDDECAGVYRAPPRNTHQRPRDLTPHRFSFSLDIYR